MFRAIWEFAQSADCVAQTVEPQVLLQQPQIPHLLY